MLAEFQSSVVDRIYRLVSTYKIGGGQGDLVHFSTPSKKVERMCEVESGTLVCGGQSGKVQQSMSMIRQSLNHLPAHLPPVHLPRI